MYVVQWNGRGRRQTHPPLPLLTAVDHQYHRKAEKPRLAYRWCRLSIVFIAAAWSASSHTDLLLLSWLQHTTGPASTKPLATNDQNPVAYFVRSHECEWRQTLTSLRAHASLISWGPRNQRMIRLWNKPRTCTIMWQYLFNRSLSGGRNVTMCICVSEWVSE